MNLLSWKSAQEKYYQEGMDRLFTFPEYVKYLETCKIIVCRNS